MPEYYRVTRTFLGPDSKRLLPGEVVEAGGWRNLSKLVAQGRMVPTAPPASPESARKEPTHGQSRH